MNLRERIAFLEACLAEQQERERHSFLQSRMVFNISLALAERGSLRSVLNGCCETVVKDLEAAFARIWTLNAAENVLELQASAGLYTHLDGPHGRVPVGAFKIGRIAESRQPHLTNDVRNDPQVSDPEWAKREGMVAFAGHPLMIDDRLVGVMAVFSRKQFSEGTLNLLGAVAAITGHGIDRRRLDEERASMLESTAAALKAYERSNEALQRFAAIASHDLREPLRQVSSFSQLLERRCNGLLDDKGREYVAFIQEGARRMSLLIEGLLAYSQVEAMTVTPMEIADSELSLAQAMKHLAAAIQEAQAVITHDPLPTVHGNQFQLGQLFQNLLGNAIKYRSEAPPRIHISAVRQPAEWVFSVRDNGIGIAPEDCRKIFGVFTRLHGKDYAGVGLGLAFCSKIVELHRGRIWAESEVGKGSMFLFAIPA